MISYLENLENAVSEVKEAFPGMTILENEPMREHDSFKIGGPVRALAVPGDVFALMKLCAILKKNHISPLVIGNGTNVVFPDEGLEIFAVSTEKLRKIRLQEDGSIYAEAGVPLSRLASFAQKNGLTGLEFASGIPGSVGGAVLMNAGAYGGEMKDAVRSVVALSLSEQELIEAYNEDCDFSYRHSAFEKYHCVILSVVFELQKGEESEIAAKMAQLNEKRRESQPLDLPSAGSAFKRPENNFAAALIEKAGLKGRSVGGAQVSQKHSGFIVNTGGATYKDLVSLMEQVRQEVFSDSGIVLEPEIKIYPEGMRLADNTAELKAAAAVRGYVEKLKAEREEKEE